VTLLNFSRSPRKSSEPKTFAIFLEDLVLIGLGGPRDIASKKK